MNYSTRGASCNLHIWKSDTGDVGLLKAKKTRVLQFYPGTRFHAAYIKLRNFQRSGNDRVPLALRQNFARLFACGITLHLIHDKAIRNSCLSRGGKAIFALREIQRIIRFIIAEDDGFRDLYNTRVGWNLFKRFSLAINDCGRHHALSFLCRYDDASILISRFLSASMLFVPRSEPASNGHRYQRTLTRWKSRVHKKEKPLETVGAPFRGPQRNRFHSGRSLSSTIQKDLRHIQSRDTIVFPSLKNSLRFFARSLKKKK